MEHFSEIEETILSINVFSCCYKVDNNSPLVQDFVSAYLDLTSSSSMTNSNLKSEEPMENQSLISTNDTFNPEFLHSNAIQHNSAFIHSSNASDNKKIIHDFKDGSFNRTYMHGDKVDKFSTLEYINTPKPMTRHVTVFFNGDGISKPIVEERFEREDREFCIDGVKQKSKNEENKEVMEELLKEIEDLNSMEVKKKETQEKRRREKSIKLLECLEESENEYEPNMDSEEKETECIETDKNGRKKKKENFETMYASHEMSDCDMLKESTGDVDDKMNVEIDDVEVVHGKNEKSNGIEIIDMDEMNREEEEDYEMKRWRYEHLLGNRVSEWVDELVQVAHNQEMTQNACDAMNVYIYDTQNNTIADAEVGYQSHERISTFQTHVRPQPNPRILSQLGLPNVVNESMNLQCNVYANGNGNDGYGNDNGCHEEVDRLIHRNESISFQCNEHADAYDAHEHGCHEERVELHQMKEQKPAFEPTYQPRPNTRILSLLGMNNDSNGPINEYVNEYANVYVNEYANFYGNEYANIYANEYANTFYNYDSECYDGDVNMQKFRKNECFENNDVYDYVGCEDGVFCHPVYKSGVTHGVGFDSDVIYSDKNMNEYLYASNTEPALCKPAALESLGSGTGLGAGVGMQVEELQKLVDLCYEYKTMDGVKEDGKEGIRNMNNEIEIDMMDCEMGKENEMRNGSAEKMCLNEMNTKNDYGDDDEDKKETFLIRDVEIITTSRVKVKAVLKLQVVSTSIAAKNDENKNATIFAKTKKWKKMKKFVSSAVKGLKKLFSCFGY